MDGNMNRALRRIAVVMGILLLLISIKWSKDGFNFSVAGDSGDTSTAVLIGYALAVAGTVIQFVFSTNLRELNASLIAFGVLAYGYSIYTNYEGILQFQGNTPNNVMALVLGLTMDGVPEPLIAWGLGESLNGDFVGNLLKGGWALMTGAPIGGKSDRRKEDGKGSGGGGGGGGDKGRGGGDGERKHIPYPPGIPRGQSPVQMSGPKPNGGTGPLSPVSRENRGNPDKFRR